ncbi:MAG TPA: SGNH/GDSL hydrolase family protein [Chloroflexota bacterium]
MAIPAVGGPGARDLPQREGTTKSFPWLPFAILLGVAVIFVAMLAEIGLRVADLRATNLAGLQCLGSGTLLEGQKGLYVLDATAGYSMRPNTCVRLKTSEYDGILRTNGRGMVGPDLPAVKPPGEFRIVVLGDSYAVGGQVPYAQTFPAVLEQLLHEAGYANVRVINAGVGGYTTFNESGLLTEHLAWLQPDLVVVAAFLGNDISENVLATAAGYRDAPEHPKGMTWAAEAARLVDQSGSWFPRNHLGGPTPPPAWDPGQPLPEPVGNPPPTSAPAPVPPQPPTIGQRTRQAAHAVWDTARTKSLLLAKIFGAPIDQSVSTAPGAAPPAVDQQRLNLTSFEWAILRDVPHTYWLDVAWPLFGRYLAETRDTAASVGARVVVMAIPEMSQFDDQVRARTMANFRFRDDEVDWQRPQRELAVQTRQDGLPLLDLLPAFQSRPDRADLYLRIDTHFTANGHRVTAEALETFLADGGYLPPK